MKFTSVKEMEASLLKVTSLKQLQEDITFKSLGKEITVKLLGVGSSAGQKEIAYLAHEGSDQMKVKFTGDGDAITVSEVKITLR